MGSKKSQSKKSQQMPQPPPPPPPPQQLVGGGTPSFGDSRRGTSGDGSGNRAGVYTRGVRTGGQDEEEEKAGLGLSAASIGSVAGELRGGELERVRGRVADLGAAIETSQVWQHGDIWLLCAVVMRNFGSRLKSNAVAFLSPDPLAPHATRPHVIGCEAISVVPECTVAVLNKYM